MSLVPATVKTVACNFVDAVKTYIFSKKYNIEPCIDNSFDKFVEWSKIKDFESCLTIDEICKLDNTQSTITVTVEPTVACDLQISSNISQSYQTNQYDVNYKNNSGYSVYPSVHLTNNSLFVTGDLKLEVTGPSTQLFTIPSGCMSGVCNTSNQASVKLHFDLPLSGFGSGSYLKSIRLFSQSSPGVVNPTFVDYNIDPATSPYMASSVTCPSCVSVNTSQLVLIHANFPTEFGKVLDNISRYHFGGVNHSSGVFLTAGSVLRFYSNIKHNPTGNFIGFNRIGNNRKLVVYNTSTTSNQDFFLPNSGTSGTPLWYDFSQVVPTVCGDQTYTVSNTYTQLPDLDALATFNKFSFNSSVYKQAIPLTTPLVVCPTTYTLTATYPTTNVANVAWKQGVTTLSTTNTLTVSPSSPTTYLFVITLTNGCVVGKEVILNPIDNNA